MSDLEAISPNGTVKVHDVPVAPILADAVLKYSKEIRQADELICDLTHQLRLLHQALGAVGKAEGELLRAAHERDRERHEGSRD